MNWSQIRNQFIATSQDAAGATAEWDIHVNEGYRQVCARMDVRELETTDETVWTTDGQDWVLLPSNVFSVIQVDDITNALRIQPEPDGMRGRSQYLDSNSPGKPAEGPPNYYDVTGQRLYLRPTPDGDYQLRIRYKMQPPIVDDTMYDECPLLPEHLHMAIVYAAAVSYFNTHPDANKPLAEVGATYGMLAQAALDKKIQEAMLPKQRERFDQSGRAYMPGFSRWRTW